MFLSVRQSSVLNLFFSRSASDRVRRSLFNVPGSDERKLKKASTLGADSIVFDLEDGVAFNRKSQARNLVLDSLENLTLSEGSEKAVRINHVGSGLELEDLSWILKSPNLEAIVIPKVEFAHQVFFVGNVINAWAPVERRSQIRLLAAIESAQGLLNLKEIASSDPRLDALIFASEDFVADTGMIRTQSRKELLFARSSLVAVACAQGLQSIDLVCVDYQNESTLREECLEGKQMGFTGKQAIHPNQIALVQELFSPSEREIEKASKIVDGFRSFTSQGIGAFTLDGKMIDLPVVKWAEKVLNRAQRAGKFEKR